MNFHEPTQNGLKAQAGWALVKRSQTTPEHAVALDKYREGCESLIPYANSGTAEQGSGEVKLPVESAMPSRFEQRAAWHQPESVPHAETCADGKHRFNIHDQHCLYCGITKFQALAQRGRKPELMV